MHLGSAEQCFALAVIAVINSQTQYFHKAERQRLSGCCQHTRAVHTRTFLHSLRVGSGEELVIKQPNFHSSTLPTILRNLQGGGKSPKTCMTLHRGPKISPQNQARPLCFPLFVSTLFLKTTIREVYILLDIQVPFFA